MLFWPKSWQKLDSVTRYVNEIFCLFRSTFGEIKYVRLPKKMSGTGSHRGFGFVEFLTKQDAKVRIFQLNSWFNHFFNSFNFLYEQNSLTKVSFSKALRFQYRLRTQEKNNTDHES